MAEFVVMPKLGFDMREGVLVSWLKEIGEEVAKGDIIAEIESDKATLELESQVSGTLLALLEEAGAVVPVGANMAIVGAEGEDISALADETGSEDEPEKVAKAEPEPAAAPASAPAANGQKAAVSGEFPGGVKATPVARRVAGEHDVDLTQVSGTGPGGRVRKADVEAYLESPRPAAAPAAAPVMPTAAPVEVGTDDYEEALPRLRQAIARRMTESKVTVPHFYVTSEIDMAAAMALRKQLNEMVPPEEKISVNDLIVKATGLALRQFPALNASYNGDSVVFHKRINVGSAVAVEGGLLTVVQKDTDTSTVSKVAADHKAMIARARSGKIHPDDVARGTFTVSNLGGFDVENFIAIINPPDAAILAIGSVKQVPVVVDGELAIGMRMKATISADHRVTDGAEAARFMQELKAILENPMRLLL